MARTRPARTAVVLTAAAILGTSLPVAAPATAATTIPTQLRYAGASVWGATLPASQVNLEAWSSTPATKIELVLDGRVMASDPTIEVGKGYWSGTGTVDLRGRTGSTKITMWITGTDGTVQKVAKSFTVSPTAPAPAPAPAVQVQPDQIRWNGASIYKAVVPGDKALPLEIWSSTSASKVELLSGSRVIATDTTVEPRSGYWLGTATVDLSALSAGAASLTMRVTATTGAVRTSTKPFTVAQVVAPATTQQVTTRPGPGNTGVPAGVSLRPSGSLRITENGAVISGLDVAGCVVVAADNVTIRNSRIRCTNAPKKRAVITEGTRVGLLLEDVEIDGGGVTDIAVDTHNVTLRRVNIHHVNDGVRMGSNITVENSWIHDMSRIGTLHPDAIQGISAQNVVIRGNHLDPRDPESGDNGNAAIMLGSETGTKLSKNVLIENNFLDGGNCTLNVRGDINAQNIVVRNNRFGSNSKYGPVLTPRHVPMGTGNVMDAFGTAIRIAWAS